MLAHGGRRAGGARLGEAQPDRVVDGARHLGIRGVGEDAGMSGLLVVDHVGQPADDAEGNAGAGEGAFPLGVGPAGEHRHQLLAQLERRARGGRRGR